MDNIWPAALRASPNNLYEWTDFKPKPMDLALNQIELTPQLQGPALDLKNKLHNKQHLLQQVCKK